MRGSGHLVLRPRSAREGIALHERYIPTQLGRLEQYLLRGLPKKWSELNPAGQHALAHLIIDGALQLNERNSIPIQIKRMRGKNSVEELVIALRERFQKQRDELYALYQLHAGRDPGVNAKQFEQLRRNDNFKEALDGVVEGIKSGWFKL
jgi:hypothetical protein